MKGSWLLQVHLALGIDKYNQGVLNPNPVLYLLVVCTCYGNGCIVVDMPFSCRWLKFLPSLRCCRWFPLLLLLYWCKLLRNLFIIWDVQVPLSQQWWNYQENKHIFSFIDLNCGRAVLQSFFGPSLEEQIVSYIPVWYFKVIDRLLRGFSFSFRI